MNLIYQMKDLGISPLAVCT